MTHFSSASELVGLPGYLDTIRLVHGTPGGSMFRPAWSKLELFTTAAAVDFLLPKIEKALQIQDKDAAADALVEIGLGFGIMAVFADRENNAYIEEMAQRAREVSAAKDPEREAEEGQTHPETGIDW